MTRFSAFSHHRLDKNKDGKFDREELAELAQVNVESLSEYEYFSFLKKGRARLRNLAASRITISAMTARR